MTGRSAGRKIEIDYICGTFLAVMYEEYSAMHALALAFVFVDF